jgi:hypothetical protein
VKHYETSTLEQLQRDLRAMRESFAWAEIIKSIDADVVAAAYALANSAEMSEREMHFRRGAIHAARGVSSVVDSLLMQVENELLLRSAQGAQINQPRR